MCMRVQEIWNWLPSNCESKTSWADSSVEDRGVRRTAGMGQLTNTIYCRRLVTSSGDNLACFQESNKH